MNEKNKEYFVTLKEIRKFVEESKKKIRKDIEEAKVTRKKEDSYISEFERRGIMEDVVRIVNELEEFKKEEEEKEIVELRKRLFSPDISEENKEWFEALKKIGKKADKCMERINKQLEDMGLPYHFYTGARLFVEWEWEEFDSDELRAKGAWFTKEEDALGRDIEGVEELLEELYEREQKSEKRERKSQ